jgi:hypothetical protein
MRAAPVKISDRSEIVTSNPAKSPSPGGGYVCRVDQKEPETEICNNNDQPVGLTDRMTCGGDDRQSGAFDWCSLVRFHVVDFVSEPAQDYAKPS